MKKKKPFPVEFLPLLAALKRSKFTRRGKMKEGHHMVHVVLSVAEGLAALAVADQHPTCPECGQETDRCPRK